MKNIELTWFKEQFDQVNQNNVLLSYSQKISNISIQKFLQIYKQHAKTMWLSEENRASFAGVGKSIEFKANGPKKFKIINSEITRLFKNTIIDDHIVPKEIGPKVFGGFSFSNSISNDEFWSHFGSAYFILPKIQLSHIQDESWITINLNVNNSNKNKELSKIQDLIDLVKIHSETRPSDNFNSYLTNQLMDYENWNGLINKAIVMIKNQDIKKIVLCRRCLITGQNNIDTLNVLLKLHHNYPECFSFLFEPEINNSFLGATPELLVEVNNTMLVTSSLAGSYPRGRTKQEDIKLGIDLLNDPKELSEHQIVIDQLTTKLAFVSSNIHSATDPILMKLNNIQHLKTEITAEIKQNINIIDIIEKLHPTPAVGGEPLEKARQIIEEFEGNVRGWYAGPIGWIDRFGDGVFAVAIRSAICKDEKMILYAGAGIVENSFPLKEWDETQLKFKPLLGALDIDL